MPNYKIINSEANPLYAQSTTPYLQGAVNGQIYDITTGSIDVAANGFLLVQLNIPAETNKTVYIIRLAGGATVNTRLDILRNAAFSGSGTAITPHNNNWSYLDSSTCTAKYSNSASDTTSGGELMITLIQNGGQMLVAFDGRLVIPSSSTERQFYIRIKNDTNQVNSCSLSLAYWEK
ncbi:MAG: hypothetical protein PHX14_05905 [Syntrophomonadaceae bacterium]|nr:hypothetical protein [Syntrophomonadaceae bacterium]